VQLGEMSATLYGVTLMRLTSLSAALTLRADGGLHLTARVQTLRAFDLSMSQLPNTEDLADIGPFLRQSLWAAGGGDHQGVASDMRTVHSEEDAAAYNKIELLQVVLELKPLDGSVPLRLAASLDTIRLQARPRMLSALLHFVDLPPTQWQATSSIESDPGIHAATPIMEQPLSVTLRISAPQLLLIDDDESALSSHHTIAQNPTTSAASQSALFVDLGDAFVDFSPSGASISSAYLSLHVNLSAVQAALLQIRPGHAVEWLLRGEDALPQPQSSREAPHLLSSKPNLSQSARARMAPSLSEGAVSSSTLIPSLSLKVTVSLRMAPPVHSEPQIRIGVHVPALRCSLTEADVELLLKLAERLVGAVSAVDSEVYAEKHGSLRVIEHR
jgi:hypothetical protein